LAQSERFFSRFAPFSEASPLLKVSHRLDSAACFSLSTVRVRGRVRDRDRDRDRDRVY